MLPFAYLEISSESKKEALETSQPLDELGNFILVCLYGGGPRCCLHPYIFAHLPIGYELYVLYELLKEPA
jgi:hypothetical protein